MDSTRKAQLLKEFMSVTASKMTTAVNFLSHSNFLTLGQALDQFYEKFAPINASNNSEVPGSVSSSSQKRKNEEILLISDDEEDPDGEDVVFVSEQKAKKLKLTGCGSKSSTASFSSSGSRSSSSEKEFKRKVLIDGSNVAIAFSRQNFGKNYNKNKPESFSVEGLKICINYFVKKGFEAKAIVPEYRLRTDKSSNCRLINKMKDEGVLIVTPAKSYDDTILLESALRINAAVVSNDFFRDLKGKGFDDVINNRIIRYNVVFNELILANDPYGRNGPKLDEILYYKK